MQKDINFFCNIVSPTVEDYLLEPTNVRKGFLASIVLYHMSDYWKIETSGDIDALKKKCPEFVIINDVCDAAKHCSLRNPNRSVTNSDQVNATNNPGLFQAPFGVATFAEASEVIVTLNNGRPTHLKPIVEAVFSMWKGFYPS